MVWCDVFFFFFFFFCFEIPLRGVSFVNLPLLPPPFHTTPIPPITCLDLSTVGEGSEGNLLDDG